MTSQRRFVSTPAPPFGVIHGRQPPAPPPCSFFSGLVAELDEVGWGRLVALGTQLSSLAVRVQDAAGRQHEVRVVLPPGYPQAAPSVEADLPRPLELRWAPGDTLAGALRQVEAALGEYQASHGRA